MATMLSPEEQVMGAIGSTGIEPQGGFDITGALQEGYTPKDISEYLAQKKGFDIAGARAEGYRDEQIIAHLMGENAFSAGMKQFIQAGGSSIKGIAQKLGPGDGLLNTERALAERQAADIAAANNRVADIAGFVAGSILDPVALPAVAVAPLKGATMAGTLLRQGAAQGAFAGFLEPVLTPEDSVVKNILFGTTLGAGFGAGLGKLIDKMGAKAADVVDPVKAAEDASLTKQASKTAIEDVAKAAPEPQAVAVERAITGEGVMSRVPSDAEVQALLNRRAGLQSEIDNMRWQEAEAALQAAPQASPPQVASLLRGETPAPVNVADNLPSTSRGLFTPTREEPTQQVAALFQRPQQAAPEVPATRAPQQAALFQGGLSKAIETRQAEIANINTRLAEREQLIANRNKPELIQVETKQPSAATSNATPTQKLPAEPGAPKAPETDYAEGRSALNLGFGKGSIGSAETPKELVYAGDVPFNTKAEKVFSGYTPKKLTVANVRNDPEDTELVNKIVMSTGSTGRGLRGQRQGPASFENMGKRAETAEAKMTREASDLIDWVLQNGNKEWNADEIAAIAPQFYKSVDFMRNTLREYNALREAGKMTDELETEIMLKSQMHLGIVTIFQGQRTKASAKMNALKYAKDKVLSGERVNGYITPGVGCV